jgi:hypothetical protein
VQEEVRKGPGAQQLHKKGKGFARLAGFPVGVPPRTEESAS